MEKIGYDLSLNIMAGFTHKLDVGRFSYDEAAARQSLAVNIQARIIITMGWYVILALGLLLIGTVLRSPVAATMLFAANVGLLANCLLAIIHEYSMWPAITRYEGLDKDKQLHFKLIVRDKNDPDEMTFGLEEAGEIYDKAVDGNIVVIFIPPTGDMIYDVML